MACSGNVLTDDENIDAVKLKKSSRDISSDTPLALNVTSEEEEKAPSTRRHLKFQLFEFCQASRHSSIKTVPL